MEPKNSDRSEHGFKRIFLFGGCFILLPSYVLHHYLNLDINLLYATFSIASLIACISGTRLFLPRGLINIILVINFIGGMGSLLAGVYSQMLMAISLSINLFIAFTGFRIFKDHKSLTQLSLVALAIVFGAVIGLLYAYTGGTPLAEIDLYGRMSYFYLSTFTNSVTGNLIRPAGIFDEPGALAMYVTLIVIINEALRVNAKFSLLLLIAGLASGSFALLFIFAAYVILKFRDKSKIASVAIGITLVTFFILNDTALAISDQFFFNRLEIQDGRLVGDNRTHQIEFFIENVNWDMAIHGQKALGGDFGVYDVSSNPFSVFYSYGLLIWLPYLALEIWLLYCAFFYRPHLRFPALALFLTLLQRPYLYNMHWGMPIMIAAVAIYHAQRASKDIRR